MKTITIIILILFTSILCYGQNIEQELKIENDGQCKFYFDEHLNIRVYVSTETIAEFESGDSDFIKNIFRNITLTVEEHKEVTQVCGSFLRFYIIIDDDGNICSYIPILKDKSIRKGKDYTSVDKK